MKDHTLYNRKLYELIVKTDINGFRYKITAYDAYEKNNVVKYLHGYERVDRFLLSSKLDTYLNASMGGRIPTICICVYTYDLTKLEEYIAGAKGHICKRLEFYKDQIEYMLKNCKSGI